MCSNVNLSYIISYGVLVIPSVMYYYLGINFVKYISASYYLSVLTSVISQYVFLIPLLINSAVMIVVGAGSAVVAGRRYCKCRW